MTDRRLGLAVAGVLALAGAASGSIDLEFRALTPSVGVGDIAQVGLYAVSDGPASQSLSAVEAIFGWDTSFLGLVGVNNSLGSVSLLSSALPLSGSSGLNEASPPADGDAIYVALAPFAPTTLATPGGSLLTVLEFTALAQTPGTEVALLASGGAPLRTTVVFGGGGPNQNVTGALSGASVRIIPAPSTMALLTTLGVVAARRRR